MPEPKPALRSTHAPVAQSPAAPTRPAPDLKCPALRGADRRAPLAEQEAKLACATPALAGQPAGTALANANAATHVARQGPRASAGCRDAFATLSGVRDEFGRLGQEASRAHIEHTGMPGSALLRRTSAELRRHADAYHGAEAAVATVGPLWTAAASISELGDLRYTAAMGTFERAGLVRGEDAGLDERKIDMESRAFAEGARGEPMKPLDTGTGKLLPAMKLIHTVALNLNSSIAEQRAAVLRRQAKEALAGSIGPSASDSLGLLFEIGKLVGAIASLVGAPSPKAVLDAAQSGLTLASALATSKVLGERAAKMGEQADDSGEKARWFGFEAAMTGLAAQCESFGAELDALDKDAAGCTAELRSVGHRHDRAVLGGEQPTMESHAAIGLHLGKVLEAQRFNEAAVQAWRAVHGTLCVAQVAASNSLALPAPVSLLDRYACSARLASVELDGVAARRNELQARYGQRRDALSGAFATVVSNLSPLGEDRSR